MCNIEIEAVNNACYNISDANVSPHDFCDLKVKLYLGKYNIITIFSMKHDIARFQRDNFG